MAIHTKVFSREQLITAMRKYNMEQLEKPDAFDSIDASLDCAVNQVDHLITYVEPIN